MNISISAMTIGSVYAFYTVSGDRYSWQWTDGQSQLEVGDSVEDGECIGQCSLIDFCEGRREQNVEEYCKR